MKRHVVLMAFLCLVALPLTLKAFDNISVEGAGCSSNANCNNDFVGDTNDPSCASGKRCFIMTCDDAGDDVEFQTCTPLASGGPCNTGGGSLILYGCTACKRWLGNCTDADTGCSELPDPDEGGGTSVGSAPTAETCT